MFLAHTSLESDGQEAAPGTLLLESTLRALSCHLSSWRQTSTTSKHAGFIAPKCLHPSLPPSIRPASHQQFSFRACYARHPGPLPSPREPHIPQPMDGGTPGNRVLCKWCAFALLFSKHKISNSYNIFILAKGVLGLKYSSLFPEGTQRICTVHGKMKSIIRLLTGSSS